VQIRENILGKVRIYFSVGKAKIPNEKDNVRVNSMRRIVMYFKVPFKGFFERRSEKIIK